MGRYMIWTSHTPPFFLLRASDTTGERNFSGLSKSYLVPTKKEKQALSATHPDLAKEADGWDPSKAETTYFLLGTFPEILISAFGNTRWETSEFFKVKLKIYRMLAHLLN